MAIFLTKKSLFIKNNHAFTILNEKLFIAVKNFWV